MKNFSHVDTDEKVPVDLNKAIETTVTLSRNEWKYVADVETDLDSLAAPDRAVQEYDDIRVFGGG